MLLLFLSALCYLTSWAFLPALLALALLGRKARGEGAIVLRPRDLKYLGLPLAEFIVLGAISLAVAGSLFNPGTSWLNELLNSVLIALREEVTTTFVLVLLMGALFRRFSQGGAFTRRQLQGIVLLSALVFGLLHLFNIPGYLALYHKGQIGGAAVAAFSVINPLNAFLMGLCVKGAYVKTGSLPLCVLFHFILNITRRNFAILHGPYQYMALVPILAAYLLCGLWMLHTLPAERQLEN